MNDSKADQRRVRVFRNGRSQAVRIPKEWEFQSDEVILRRQQDGSLSLEPVPRKMSPKQLIGWLRSQSPLNEDLPEIEDFPPEPVDLDMAE